MIHVHSYLVSKLFSFHQSIFIEQTKTKLSSNQLLFILTCWTWHPYTCVHKTTNRVIFSWNQESSPIKNGIDIHVVRQGYIPEHSPWSKRQLILHALIANLQWNIVSIFTHPKSYMQAITVLCINTLYCIAYPSVELVKLYKRFLNLFLYLWYKYHPYFYTFFSLNFYFPCCHLDTASL